MVKWIFKQNNSCSKIPYDSKWHPSAVILSNVHRRNLFLRPKVLTQELWQWYYSVTQLSSASRIQLFFLWDRQIPSALLTARIRKGNPWSLDLKGHNRHSSFLNTRTQWASDNSKRSENSGVSLPLPQYRRSACFPGDHREAWNLWLTMFIGKRRHAWHSVTLQMLWLRQWMCNLAVKSVLPFSEQCGLSSLHTLIGKALFAFYLSSGTFYDWPRFPLS